MKKLLLLFSLLGLCLHAQTQSREVECPPFSIWNNTSVEIDKILLSDTATILYMTGYQRPQNWIRIAGYTYIRAKGEKKMLRYAEGIELDKEVYMDETGERPFILYFPPVDPSVERIDFIEGDCPTCFKIWGIELKSPVLTARYKVPEEILRQAEAVDLSDDPLPIPVFKAGKAGLTGQLLGYIPELDLSGLVYVNDPVTGEQYEYPFKLTEEGAFHVEVSLPCTMFVTLRINNRQQRILLTPEEESFVYYDLQELACQESRKRADKHPKGRWIYMGGANAEVNNPFLELTDSLSFNYNQLMDDINGLTAGEYKTYIERQANEKIAFIRRQKLSRKVKELAESLLYENTMDWLFMGDSYLESAYRKANHLDYRAELTGFQPPVFSPDYYRFMKDYDINNPRYLYTDGYCWLINNCKYIRFDKEDGKVQILQLTNEMGRKLAEMVELSPEESKCLDCIVRSSFENLSPEKVDPFKEKVRDCIQFLKENVDLPAEFDRSVQRIDSLNRLPGNHVKSTVETFVFLSHYPFTDSQHIKDSLQSLFFASSSAGIDTLMCPPKKIEEFNMKYEQVIRFLYSEEDFNERKKILAGLLGTGEGLVFDLMRSQMLAVPLDKKTPLNAWELASLSELKNPFYYAYLSRKNNELLLEIEANKKRGGYRVHTLSSELKGDDLIKEITRTFPDKVLLIDFWATWCSPCRSAMKQFEPVKEQFKGKEVSFVYLTDESSPLKTFESMISGITGDHFRLTNDQLGSLKKKYGVTGIPSYLILNKKGEQLFFQVGFPGAEILMNHIRKGLSM